MKIADNVFVAISYALTLDSGEEVDRSQEGKPLAFITGSGQVIPGLERELMGMRAGDSARITIEAEEAYGPVQEDLFKELPRSQFPSDMEIEEGMAFEAQAPQGPIMIVVKSIKDKDTVVVDLNHPMAGQRLNFDVKVMEVRETSAAERAAMTSMAAGCGAGCECDTDADGAPACGPGCNCG